MDFTRGHRSRTRRPVLLLLLLLRLLCIASLHFQRPKEKDFARLDSRREDECSDAFRESARFLGGNRNDNSVEAAAQRLVRTGIATTAQFRVAAPLLYPRIAIYGLAGARSSTSR